MGVKYGRLPGKTGGLTGMDLISSLYHKKIGETTNHFFFFFLKNHILICNLDGMSQASKKLNEKKFVYLLASFIPFRPKVHYKFITEDEHLNKFNHCFP